MGRPPRLAAALSAVVFPLVAAAALPLPLPAQPAAGSAAVPIPHPPRRVRIAEAFADRGLEKRLTVADVDDFVQDPVTGVSTYWPGGPRAPLGPAFTFPPGSVLPTGQDDPRYATPLAGEFSGVARLQIRVGGDLAFGCTGALIGPTTIVTAAHCVANSDTDIFASGVDVDFLNDGGGVTTIQSSSITVMPGYTGSVVDQRDLARIELATPAEPWMTQYRLFTGNPLFQDHVIAGFGLTGNGITGGVVNTLFDPVPVRRQAVNRWEFSLDDEFIWAGAEPVGAILQADFDGGDGQLLRLPTTGGLWDVGDADFNNWNCFLTLFFGGLPSALEDAICYDDPATQRIGATGFMEGLIGSGDSGGPAFIRVNGELQLAGIASFGDFFCIPDQRLDDAGNPSPRTDPGCPTGRIAVGGIFGASSGHVFVGAGAQAMFVAQVPEPATLALLALGLVPLGVLARRGRRG